MCPLNEIKNNALRREAVTHCFMSINRIHLNEHPEIPIATIFPVNLGYLKTEIPIDILNRVKGEFSFSNQTGLSELYEGLKESRL